MRPRAPTIGQGLLGSAVVLALLHAGTVPARAQTSGFALNRFQPADDQRGFFSVPSPFVAGHNRLSAALLADYSHAPLVLRTTDGADRGEVVSGQLYFHATFAYVLMNRLLFSLALPLAAGNFGRDVMPPDGPPIAAPRGAALGDVALGARAHFYQTPRRTLAVSGGARLWLPTGDRAAYTGDGTGRFGLELVAGGRRLQNLVWSAAGAFVWRTERELHGVVSDDEMQVRAAAGYRWDRQHLLVGPELVASRLRGAVSSEGRTSAELRLTGRYQPGPLFVGLSVGPGFGRASGSPSVRVLASAGWTPGEPDSPGESAAEPPPAPEPTDEPALPTEPITPAPLAVPDPVPTVVPPPEPAPPAPAGGEGDSDGDGVADRDDHCPRERGRKTGDPRTRGCPTLVRVTNQEIVTLRNVHFLTGRAYLHADSSELLAQIAQVLNEHPEIRRISIEGHTDNRGGPLRNLELSKARARTVRRWLVDKGIGAERLEARGFGSTRPLAPDDSQRGRASNRRVEFRIVDPAPLDVTTSDPGKRR